MRGEKYSSRRKLVGPQIYILKHRIKLLYYKLIRELERVSEYDCTKNPMTAYWETQSQSNVEQTTGRLSCGTLTPEQG